MKPRLRKAEMIDICIFFKYLINTHIYHLSNFLLKKNPGLALDISTFRWGNRDLERFISRDYPTQLTVGAGT